MALRALGLPEDLLDLQAEDHSIGRKHRRRMRMAMDAEEQGESELEAERMHDKPLENMREAMDRLLRKHGVDEEPFAEKLRMFADRADDRRRRAKDNLPRKIETMPEENLASGHGRADDDEPDDEYEKFRQHLQDHGLDEEAIEHAIGMAKDMHKRGMNGRDRFPRNRVMGGRGGHFGGSRDEVAEIGRQMRRIESEPGISPGADPSCDFITHHGIDRATAMDSAPTRRQLAKMHSMFPGMRRVADVNGCTPDVPTDIDVRSSAERMFGIDRIGWA